MQGVGFGLQRPHLWQLDCLFGGVAIWPGEEEGCDGVAVLPQPDPAARVVAAANGAARGPGDHEAGPKGVDRGVEGGGGPAVAGGIERQAQRLPLQLGVGQQGAQRHDVLGVSLQRRRQRVRVGRVHLRHVQALHARGGAVLQGALAEKLAHQPLHKVGLASALGAEGPRAPGGARAEELPHQPLRKVRLASALGAEGPWAPVPGSAATRASASTCVAACAG